MHLGWFLIVEPSKEAAEVVAKQCRRLRRAKVLGSKKDAVEVLDSGRSLTGLITEQTLPDGEGLEIVKHCRASYPLLPVLMLTSDTDPPVINRAHSMRAEFLAKPAHRRDLRGFLRRAVAFERVPDQRIAWIVDEMVQTKGLSPRETDILAAALDGTPRKEIADQIGTTENTIKSCIKSLLRKCEGANLESLVREIMRKALEGSASPIMAEFERDSYPPSSRFTIPPTIKNTSREDKS